MDYLEKHELIAQAAETGAYLGRRLQELQSHPSVGDVRGKGLMWGLEFVQDQGTKQPFDPARRFYNQVYQEARKRGLILLASGGCDRGQSGDMVLIGPPLIITPQQIDDMCGILDDTLRQVERQPTDSSGVGGSEKLRQRA